MKKLKRDLHTLTKLLEREPENARNWLYLAQAYDDAGRLAEAAQAYAKRADMGGQDQEETWYARLQEARCLLQLKDEHGFVTRALEAFQLRPHRAEPLYELAKHFRRRGMHDVSVLYSEPGLAIPRPEGERFVEEFVYSTGLREEYSVSANYARDAARKERGHQACNYLSLQREIQSGSRDLARSNLQFYALSAAALMPAFTAISVPFEPPGGYLPMNPSIARWNDEFVVIQRVVGSRLRQDGSYNMLDVDPLLPRNYLLRLDANLNLLHSAPILSPVDLPTPAFDGKWPLDLRLFVWRGALWCVGYIAEMAPEKRWVNQMLARIDCSNPDSCRLVDWRMLRPDGPRQLEKNWMPRVSGDDLHFFYLCDPTRVVDEGAHTVSEITPPIAAEDFRGGTQAIAFDGGWLTLVHQVVFLEGEARRYFHRFVWFDETDALRRVSRQFFFRSKGFEFASGLAWHPDGRQLLISYGLQDAESWIGRVSAQNVREILEDARNLPCGWN